MNCDVGRPFLRMRVPILLFLYLSSQALCATANLNPNDNTSNVTTADGGPWLRTGASSLSEVSSLIQNFASKAF